MIKPIDLSIPSQASVLDDGIQISIARNAWSQFVVQLDGLNTSSHHALRLPHLGEGISFTAYQVLSAPVDLNDAAYIRQMGESGLASSVPRVLLPLPVNNSVVDLWSLKEPAKPALIWIDLHTADTTAAARYSGQCELVDAQSAWSVPVQVTVENLTLPDELHLHFASGLDWSDLSRLYPDIFEAVPPRLLNRSDPRRAALLRLIDAYLQLAHENKTDLYVPRLQPIVKWPLGKMPRVDWTDFDPIASQWLTGSAFTDHRHAGFWPLPMPDSLEGFNLSSQIQYWQLAAEHFAQKQWLASSPVVLKRESMGSANEAESILLSAQARQILAAQPQITAMLPLRDDQLQMVSPSNPNAIDSLSTDRLIDLAPELIRDNPLRPWPAAVTLPRHWLDAHDAVTAAATEQGLRSLAWLAFSRDASLILCADPLPTKANPAQASQLIWAYPGQRFGADHPLATVQLKWMRQAEQDYEYLLLARPLNDDATKICGLVTKPVQLQPHQQNDDLFELLAGNTQPHGCEEARELLAGQLTRPATAAPAVAPIDLQTVRWLAAHETQTLVAHSVDWTWDANSINAAINLDVYNPAHDMPNGGKLQWTQTGEAWQIPLEMTSVPAIPQFQISKVTTHARFDLSKISPSSRQPMTLNFIDDFTRQTMPCKLVLPVAVSERRQQPMTLDGALDDWFPADAIQLNQPLVKLLNRPALQAGRLEFSQTPSSIYTGWSEDNFYLAFRLCGVAAADLRSTRNFVQYDHNRAWGEDLCELLIQPIYIDNTKGPLLHVVCKPGGSWVEQRIEPNAWQTFEACGIRYASGVDAAEKVWRGEVAIPWKAINASLHGRPGLLRFNFIQHQHASGESASWAGPIDQSRDDRLSGLLLVKDP